MAEQKKVVCDIDGCNKDGISQKLTVVYVEQGKKRIDLANVDLCQDCLNKVYDGQGVLCEKGKFTFKGSK